MSDQVINIGVTQSVQLGAIVATRSERQVNIEVSRIAAEAGNSVEYTDFMVEQLSGTVDGQNSLFTTTFPFEPTTIMVFLNGLHEKHFAVVSNTQIRLDEPAKNSGFTDFIEALYIRKQI